MVSEEHQSFEGLMEHLCDAFKSGETLSKLISNFYGHVQKTRETEDPFTDDLQVLVRMIVVYKPSFCLKANQQPKGQYLHKLWDLYYAAEACSALQSSLEEETFSGFWGCLVTKSGWHAKQGKSSVASASIDSNSCQIKLNEELGSKLSKIVNSIKTKLTGKRPS